MLLFQALLLAHGGLTTLGANTFSMAIAGPIVSWAVYKLLRKANAPAAVAVGEVGHSEDAGQQRQMYQPEQTHDELGVEDQMR